MRQHNVLCLLISATSDVQAVTATVVGESIINILCHFIHGSDAVGCKVVLASKCPIVQDEHVKLLRNAGSNLANHSLKLTSNISCFYRVFANDIDVNETIGNLTIEGEIRTMENRINQIASFISWCQFNMPFILLNIVHYYAIANY